MVEGVSGLEIVGSHDLQDGVRRLESTVNGQPHIHRLFGRVDDFEPDLAASHLSCVDPQSWSYFHCVGRNGHPGRPESGQGASDLRRSVKSYLHKWFHLIQLRMSACPAGIKYGLFIK